jgi:hypothetical protein
LRGGLREAAEKGLHAAFWLAKVVLNLNPHVAGPADFKPQWGFSMEFPSPLLTSVGGPNLKDGMGL